MNFVQWQNQKKKVHPHTINLPPWMRKYRDYREKKGEVEKEEGLVEKDVCRQ